MAASLELSMIFSSSAEEENFIEEGNLETLMENYRPSKFSQTANDKLPPKIIKGTRLTDILIGRFVSHPGNTLARKVIIRNRDYFRSLENADLRKTATDALIAFFESKGTRFLEPIGKTNNSFRVAPYNALMEKFRKSLRETGIRSDRKPPPKLSFAKRSCNKKPSTDTSKPTIPSAALAFSKPAPIKIKKQVKIAKPTVKKTIPPAVQRRPTLEQHQRGVPGGAPKAEFQQGDRLGIFWPEDNVYYPGTVLYATGTSVKFLYDDDEQETVDLKRDSFVILGKTPKDPKVVFDGFKESKLQATTFDTATTKPEPRRVSLPSSAKPSRPTQNDSILTFDSSNSSSSLSEEEKSTPIQMEGTFQQAQTAPVPSLADFLRRKMLSSASA